MVLLHFQNLFRTKGMELKKIFENGNLCQIKTLCAETISCLDVDITDDETKRVMSYLKPLESPGPDVLHAKFLSRSAGRGW